MDKDKGNVRGEGVTDKKVIAQFTVLTFCIAFPASGVLIVLGQLGFSVDSTVYESIRNLGMNIPYVVYILSPAIAGYIVLRRNRVIESFRQWLKAVFYAKASIFIYLFLVAVLVLYFLLHIAVSGFPKMAFPFYMFFLSLPGNLIIGGLSS